MKLAALSSRINALISLVGSVRYIAPVNANLLYMSLLDRVAQQHPRRLELFGRKGLSQNDEDGIIAEIFDRIGTTTRRFLEFGIGNGRENNTCLLLLSGWTGTWVEGSRNDADSARRHFREFVSSGQLKVLDTWVTRDNFSSIVGEAYAEGALDLLSIDVDGNDYHLMKTTNKNQPRVLIIEYNSTFPPPVEWIMPYDPDNKWAGDTYIGASLQALKDLGDELGYTLVCCNITGANAFFVRNDCLGEHFPYEKTAEKLYHPPRPFLTLSMFKSLFPIRLTKEQ